MNFNSVCRTCLTTQSLNPIFADSVDDKRFSAAVFITTGIKVDIDDGLPQQMCARCISFSNASLKFRRQCKDAETRLLQVKNGCDNGEAETRAVDSEDLRDEDMPLKLKAEEDSEINDDDVTVKSETDSDIEDNRSGALHTTEDDLLQLKPASGAQAAPERPHSRPGEGAPCSAGHEHQPKLRSCVVRLERLPIDNMHTCKTCLVTFDCESSLRNHESNFNKVCDETARTHFQCDTCGKQYMQKRHIIRHLTAHNEKQVEINSGNKYNKQFRNEYPLTFHTGEGPRPYICDMCSKEFSQKQHLIGHIRKLHRDVNDNMTDKYSCNVCRKRFRQLSQLTTHKRVHTHTREKSFTCDVCEKQFTTNSHLTRHRRIHTGEKPYSCRVCNKQFVQYTHLTTHMRLHTREKKFICDICNKGFIRKSTLTVHIRIHTGEKPFTCDVCKKQFTTNGEVTIHQRIHSGEKPYSCSVCSKQFAHKISLTYHMPSHTGEKKFSCDICKKGFAFNFSLTRHIRTHTGEKPFTCDVCEQQFKQSSNLTEHRRIHTGEKRYSCNVCRKQFTRKTYFTGHLKTHTG